MAGKRRVLVIGLDSLEPFLAFDKWEEELPNIRRLKNEGVWGELESSIPPITVPAWMVMMTGKDPGQLGLYGFRNRTDFSYEELGIANSYNVREKTVWDFLSQMGKRAVVIGVPPSYPPKPLNGCLISCFLTPGIESQYTYPSGLKTDIQEWVGKYMVDVEGFRTEDKEWLLGQIYEMTEKHFEVGRRLMQQESWDFFTLMEIGPDRIHHGFWKYWDKQHRLHPPEAPDKLKNAMHDYYKFLDEQVGTLLSLIDEDTVVLIVSDHGAKRMDGGVCINEWLVREGYLTVKEKPEALTPLSKVAVDWSKTIAWGAGGYYARVFINVKGREAEGVVHPQDYERVRDELAAKLEALPDDQGEPMGTRVYKPQDVYAEIRGIPPDLIVLFGDLYWRAVGSLGLDEIYTLSNDTGPDDANHAQLGLFALYDPESPGQGRKVEGAHIQHIAGTILKRLGLPTPEGLGVLSI